MRVPSVSPSCVTTTAPDSSGTTPISTRATRYCTAWLPRPIDPTALTLVRTRSGCVTRSTTTSTRPRRSKPSTTSPAPSSRADPTRVRRSCCESSAASWASTSPDRSSRGSNVSLQRGFRSAKPTLHRRRLRALVVEDLAHRLLDLDEIGLVDHDLREILVCTGDLVEERSGAVAVPGPPSHLLAKLLHGEPLLRLPPTVTPSGTVRARLVARGVAEAVHDVNVVAHRPGDH